MKIVDVSPGVCGNNNHIDYFGDNAEHFHYRDDYCFTWTGCSQCAYELIDKYMETIENNDY